MKLNILCKVLSAPGVLRYEWTRWFMIHLPEMCGALEQLESNDVFAWWWCFGWWWGRKGTHFFTTSWMWALLELSMRTLCSLFMIKLPGGQNFDGTNGCDWFVSRVWDIRNTRNEYIEHQLKGCRACEIENKVYIPEFLSICTYIYIYIYI